MSRRSIGTKKTTEIINYFYNWTITNRNHPTRNRKRTRNQHIRNRRRNYTTYTTYTRYTTILQIRHFFVISNWRKRTDSFITNRYRSRIRTQIDIPIPI